MLLAIPNPLYNAFMKLIFFKSNFYFCFCIFFLKIVHSQYWLRRKAGRMNTTPTSMNFFTSQSTEEVLVKACQRGDPAAQKAVYEKFARKMLGVCSRYVQDEMEAEDLMISGFMRVFDKINTFKNEGSFEGWVRRIMINEALGHLRRQRSLHLTVNLEDSYQEPVFTPEDTDLEAEDLLKLVQQLPDGYRTVFNLYAIEGYAHKEIAELLGISENTSKSQLSRARTLLQKNLAATEKKNETYARQGNR